MEMSSATLAITLAAAEDFGRQVVHWLLTLSPYGINQHTDPSVSALHRLVYKKTPDQERRFSGILAWGWPPCPAITPGIEPAVIEAYGRLILMDADPEKQSQQEETLNEQDRGEIEAARRIHWMRQLLLPLWVTFRPACVERGVINKGEGKTAFDNDFAHPMGWLQTDLEMFMDRDREKIKTIEGLKACNSPESCPLLIFDEECQKAEKFWAFFQAEGSPFQDYLMHARRLTVAGQISGEENEETDGRMGCMRTIRYESDKPFSGSESGAENGKFQIFIKSPTGKTILEWVSDNDSGEKLKDQIAQREGYPPLSFYLLYRGKVLPEGNTLRDYQINKESTLHVLFRLRGGTNDKQRNRGTAGPFSYKDAASSKGPHASTTRPSSQPKGTHASAVPLPTQPRPYIVEKMEDIPALEVKITEVKKLFSTLQTHALICRFNGFWPRSFDLHNWIYTNWTTSCQVLLCSKGFFMVQFESHDDYQKILLQGPWFWGRAGLFITPWFPEFDADNMVVTKIPVWVRLPNLPLPFWHHEVLEDIGNSLGKFIISDEERKEQGLFTYARICVEIDLSKGLPDKIQLQHETFKRIQALDYENTAFRCRSCHMTGHLHDSCPHARRFHKKKKGLNQNRKTWQEEYEPSINEESECEESDTEGNQREEEHEEAAPFSETREAKNSESKKADIKNDGEEPQSNSGNLMAKKDDPSPGKGTQTALVIHEGVPTGGIKRGHESEKSDSDKEQPSKQKPEMVNGRQVVIATSSQGKWVEVKNKRKGKKGKIEDYYQQ